MTLTVREQGPVYHIGQYIRVYEDLRPVKETCSHGAQHIVNRYRTIQLVVTEVQREFITALFYTEDGYGSRYLAVDQFGDTWDCLDTWDGPGMWGIWADGGRGRFAVRGPHLPCYLDGTLRTTVRYDREARDEGFYVYE